MRQGGRFDPAYMSLRERADLPLEKLFSHPDFATEISLLPRRFGVDAIIFFQDILTPLSPMGPGFTFRPGPVLAEPIRTRADVDRLTRYDPSVELGFVGKTLQQVRGELAGELPLIGFAGAPLTLACFLIEGKSPGDSGAAAPDLRGALRAGFAGRAAGRGVPGRSRTSSGARFPAMCHAFFARTSCESSGRPRGDRSGSR